MSKNVVEMTITEALRKKNLIDLSITGDRKKNKDSILKDMSFISLRKRGSNKDINGKDMGTVKAEIQSNFDTIKSKLFNRYALDSAIKLSNASTKITVAGKEYTMAEAIEYEKSYALELTVLKNMEQQMKNAQLAYIRQEENVDRKIQEQKTAFGNGGLDPAQIEASMKSISSAEDKNRYEYIDPKELSAFIVKQKTEIEEFLFEVNDAKNTSNVLTKVTVELY